MIKPSISNELRELLYKKRKKQERFKKIKKLNNISLFKKIHNFLKNES